MRTGLITGFLLMFSIVGCSPRAGEAEDHELHVVASFAPLAEAATAIGGDLISTTDLTPPGVEPHDLELTPGDLEAIASADLVIYLGAGFQPAVEEALARGSGAMLDVLDEASSLLTTEDEHGDEVPDPHLWLSPLAYEEIVGQVASALAEVDPANEDVYLTGASALQDEIRELDAEFADGLRACESDLLVTSHEAFGYLAAAYGLRQVGVTGISPEAEPTPQRLAEIRQLVLDEGIATVFAEEQLPPDSVETIARETGADVAVLDTLESAGNETYVERMRSNLEVLRDGLGCS